MNKRTMKEILTAHADQMLKGKDTSKNYRQRLSEQDKELVPLLNVAELIQSTLKPITPANKFEQELKQELLNIAQLRQAEGYTPPNPSRDLFFLVASIAFIMALSGVLIAIKLRRNTTTNQG